MLLVENRTATSSLKQPVACPPHRSRCWLVGARCLSRHAVVGDSSRPCSCVHFRCSRSRCAFDEGSRLRPVGAGALTALRWCVAVLLFWVWIAASADAVWWHLWANSLRSFLGSFFCGSLPTRRRPLILFYSFWWLVRALEALEPSTLSLPPCGSRRSQSLTAQPPGALAFAPAARGLE